MSSADRYFDYAATTPVDPRVLESMLPYFKEDFGNANSIHGFGQRAHSAVEHAREQVAKLIGAEDPSEIFFTSGATEANNWVLRSFETGYVSPFEHSSMREPALDHGFSFLTNDGWDLNAPSAASFISVMLVNNETGAILDPTALRKSAAFLHSDITQAVGKIHVDVQALDLDTASMSAHKLYGPKGIGALYLRGGTSLRPFILGGEQEQGLRGGTLNVPGIVGFGKAAEIAIDERLEDERRAQALQKSLIEELSKSSEVQVNRPSTSSPFILSVSFGGLQGETMVVEADSRGFAISSGAACSSRSTEPSHVLTALGLVDYWLKGTVRISLGRFTTESAVFELARTLNEIAGTIRRMSL
ncbi:MAG: cysteine desulfurase [Fimbriimonadaceae bacterium]|nr:cysteine desulfurase [Fimbriimonadaceae bacterium]